MAPTEDTSQPSPGDHPASKEEYDGVLSDDINTSAWSAMSSIIHEVDERKIKGYKEDIDTFLVFAGLFSAVLSAFLVESYQGLQQDPMEVMVALMQQVALQTYSYSLNAGFLNSTVPPLSQQTLFAFQPSVNAVRVNVLWFASLTLSLISASFGILVKQWLREYLAGDYTSPQARLRVRHYRNPGLDNWKVFEIAAILPLLLQLSLALFFIGLCIFTADVHSTIGHTTLPLVAAWGFLFVASAIAPAFSPRCPYKTTLFKSITRIIWKQQLSLVHCLRTAYSRLNLGLRAPNTRAARHSPGSHVQILIPGKWPYEDPAYDEEVAAKTDVNDLDILLTVDSIQSDDDLLRTMMNTLQQSQVARTEYVRFALAIISHRLQIDVIPSSGFLDLLRLPRQVASTIMPPISEILRREINRQLHAGDMRTVEWHDWMKDCLFILFAKTSIAMPAQADLLFLSLLTDQSRCTTFFNMIQIRAPDVDAVPHILERLQGTLNAMNGGDVLLVLYHLVQEYFSPESPANYQTFLDTLKNSQKVPLEILQLFVDTLVIRVGIELSEPRWEPYILAKISLIIELSSKISCRDGVLSLFQTLLSWNSNFTGLGRYAMGLNRSTDSTSLKEGAQSMFIDVILAASRISELHKILETFSILPSTAAGPFEVLPYPPSCTARNARAELISG
ncbi:hypothetical protein BC835DRAFT_133037 [Cytidiella melzeri]|nr:hypothetical protein BC835DRAFT_133037 [Cytidiella melzeri]